MKCEESAEFVSALIDGEPIPRDAAEHIGLCASCKIRLKEYVEISVELRRAAVLTMPDDIAAHNWSQEKVTSHWWQKGLQTMRVPRLAFASLLIVIVALTSGLVMQKVRAQAQSPILMLHVTTANSAEHPCPLLIQGQHSAPCGSVLPVGKDIFVSGYRVLSVDGSRVQIGVRTVLKKLAPGQNAISASSNDIEGTPETEYSFEPGEKLEIQGDGSTPITITGEYLDHLPPLSDENSIDPEPNFMRIVSPLLLKDKNEIFDFEGSSATQIQKGFGADIYSPKAGLYVVSLTPFPGAVEGKINQSRISFQIGGSSYELLTAVPIARAEKAWILRDPDFQPSKHYSGTNDDQPYAGAIRLDQIYSVAAGK